MENPLKINTSVEHDDENGIYTFNFEINFRNETSQYFLQNDNDLVNGDYDIGYGRAYFRVTGVDINYETYDIEGNSYDKAILVNGVPNNSGYVDINNNNTVNISLRLDDNTYNAIRDNDPDKTVYVRMKYETYHPMSEANVFATKHFTNRNGHLQYDGSTQRMIVFSKVPEDDTVTIKSGDSEDGGNPGGTPDDLKYCKQDSNTFTYDNAQVDLDTFIDNCDCIAVDSEKLDSDNLSIYNSRCPKKNEVTVENNLKDCDDTSSKDNTIKYTSRTTINDFCNLECTETVGVTGMTGPFTTMAGRYFELDSKLNISFNKKCNVDIDHNKFNDTYADLLKKQIDAYNAWQEHVAQVNAQEGTEKNEYGEDVTVYRYSYTAYDNNNSLTSRNVSASVSNRPELNSSYKDNFSIQTGNLNKIFTQMNSCSVYLKNINDFYEPSNEVKFYYEQDVTDKNNAKKTVRNDNTEYTNLDDSGLNVTAIESANSSGGNYNSVGTKNFDVLDEDGKSSNTIYYSSDDLDREQSFGYEYTPSQEKYVNTFYGTLSGEDGDNNIRLGYVYNILVNAIEKSGNEDYYYFKTLGDKGQISTYYDKNYEYSSSEKKYNKYNDLNKLIRKCTYEIKNDVIDCEEPNCPDTDSPSFNPVFRIVDTENIDPNNRLNSTDEKDGFKNWRNIKGSTVKELMKNEDTFNPNNIEYSFSLDSATMKAIREYNDVTLYSDFLGFECNDAGNECKSSFIKESMKDEPNLNGVTTKKFGDKNTGSDKWRYLVCEDNTTCEIKIYKTGDYGNYLDKQKELRNLFASDSNNKELNP